MSRPLQYSLKSSVSGTMGVIDPPTATSSRHEHNSSAAAAGATAQSLLPQVAAALGISDHDDEKFNSNELTTTTTDPRNTMADVSLSHPHSGHNQHFHHDPPTHRSAASAVISDRYGEQDDGDDAPRSPHRRTQSTPAEESQPTLVRDVSVQATPLVSLSSLSSSAPPVQYVQQVYPFPSPPPMARAVPIPASDQPDQCTSGVLYYKSKPLAKAQITQLRALGYSDGLIQGLNDLKDRMPLRFWLVDNSGSMLTNDGRELRGYAGRQAVPYTVECTRWVELQGTVAWHASLAGVLGTHTVFRLLNAPEQMPHVHEFAVADPSNSKMSAKESVDNAKNVMNRVVPRGFTPLTQHLQRIRESVASIQGTLRARGQQAVIVIATDGTPTNEIGDSTESAREEFKNILKAMQNLSLWLVIRLCTDDPEVVSYYNSLDGELELSIEVIDDYFHEAEQVNTHNPWINYAMPLHRCREMGFHPRVLDLLDERSLNKDELLEFLQLVFGEAVMQKAPDLQSDWRAFSTFLQALLDVEMQHYNPITKKMCQWIDMKELNRCYGGSGSFMSIFRRSKKG